MGCQRSILANTVTPPQPKGVPRSGVPRSGVAGSDYTDLTFANGAIGTAIYPLSHSYKRDFGTTGKNPDRETWWNCFFSDKSPSTGIDYMETHSFEVDEDSLVNICIDQKGGIQSTHFVALYKGPRAVSDKQAYNRLKWGDQFFPTDAGNNAGGEGIKVGQDSPAHFTIIPCDEYGQCCPNRVYSLFFVVPLGKPGYLDTFKNVAQVNLSGTGWWDAAYSNSTWNDKLKISGNPYLFARPQWTYDPAGDGTLSYWGTIVGDRMGTHDSVLIWLDKEADVDVPITTRYFQITNVKTLFTDANTKQPIPEDVWNDLIGKRSAVDVEKLSTSDYPVKFDLKAFQAQAQMKNDAVNQQMVVYGTGRISGAQLVEDMYYPTYGDFGSILANCPGIPESSRVDGFPRLRDVLRLGEYFVRSGLLSICSNFNDPAVPAIDCFNVQVGWGAKQQHGSIGLNSNWDGDENPKPGRAKLFDVKLCGNYVDASDGPDLMAPKSLIQSCYLMTTDDGIKISSDGGKYLDNTLIQGCVGSAVMIGSYGAAGSIGEAEVDGVYIHRLCQGVERDNNDDKQHGFPYETGGMIATRTYPYAGANYHLDGITIKGVYVPALGGTDKEGKDPTYGPNCLQRVFAIGSDLPFGVTFEDAEQKMKEKHRGEIGQIAITSSDILCNPILPSLFHNYLDSFTMKGPFIFSDGDLSDPTDIGDYALKVWPTGAMDGDGWFYTVPGFTGDSKANGVKALPDATGTWTYEPFDADTANYWPETPWLTGLIQKPYR